MKLLLGTSNTHKVMEILQITDMDASCVTTPANLNIRGEPVEDGLTFVDNAVIKAVFYYKRSGLPVLAEDTGLEVFALDGLPGLNSARFAGIGHDDAANRKKLVGMVEALNDRSARFVCHAVLVMPPGIDIGDLPDGIRELSFPAGDGVRLFYAFGQVRGKIVTREAGQGGFGYDPIFFLPDMGMTFAQVPQEHKNLVSHRANAMKSMFPFIRQIGLADC